MLLKALARVWRWQKLLDCGALSLGTEIGAAERISKSYVSRILRLALLAPDIVEAILGGWQPKGLRLANGPLGWDAQRATCGFSN